MLYEECYTNFIEYQSYIFLNIYYELNLAPIRSIASNRRITIIPIVILIIPYQLIIEGEGRLHNESSATDK